MSMTHRVLSLALLIVLGSGAAMAFDLARAGQPVATLVVPDEALPVVTAAAVELQYHVARASGATLPIVKESAGTAPSGLVFLGPCQATLALGLRLEQLQPNGYFARSANGNLYLIGDDSAGDVFWVQHGNRTRVGTLFAVYDLLEKQLGVRWLWPGPLGEVIPKRDTIAVTVADATVAPPFVHTRWREGGIYMSGTKGWADQKNRSIFLNEQGKWLRRHRFAMGLNMDMAHSFTTWWERFGKDHPEYFNLLPDGTRRSDPLYFGGDKSLIAMCVGQPACGGRRSPTGRPAAPRRLRTSTPARTTPAASARARCAWRWTSPTPTAKCPSTSVSRRRRSASRPATRSGPRRSARSRTAMRASTWRCRKRRSRWTRRPS